MSQPSNIMPLQGVRVVDMSRLLPGPYCTQILADLGADVIKVEDPPTYGDYLRNEHPVSKDGQSPLFHFTNRGKRSIAMNLREQKDKDMFKKLLSASDVFVDSFRPGTLKKVTGYTQQELLAAFPHLIICSITGFGQEGEYSQHAGHDLNFLATSGALGMMRKPASPGIYIGDIGGGSYPAALQIIAALYGQKSRGKKVGCILDISMTHNTRAFLCLSAAYELQKSAIEDNTNPLKQLGNLFHPSNNRGSGVEAGYTVYKTKDGYMAVAGTENKFWNNTLVVLGLPKEPMASILQPKRNEELVSKLQDIFLTKTNDEWVNIIKEKGFVGETCITPVIIPTKEWFINEQTKVGQVVHVQIPNIDTPVPMPGTSLSPMLSRQQTTVAPKLGQHTEEILEELLHLKARL